MRRLLAGNWWEIVFCGGAVVIGLVIGMSVYPSESGLLPAALAGAVGGFLLSFLPLSIMSYIVQKRNGAPFQEGDVVQLLSGDHAGETTTVYEVWKDRRQVRVHLGEQAKADVRDVYSYMEICRVKSCRK